MVQSRRTQTDTLTAPLPMEQPARQERKSTIHTPAASSSRCDVSYSQGERERREGEREGGEREQGRRSCLRRQGSPPPAQKRVSVHHTELSRQASIVRLVLNNPSLPYVGGARFGYFVAIPSTRHAHPAQGRQAGRCVCRQAGRRAASHPSLTHPSTRLSGCVRFSP